MSEKITFESPQNVTVVAKEEIAGISEMNPWQATITSDNNGNLSLSVYAKEARVPFVGCCKNDQAKLNADIKPAWDILLAHFKEAIEAGDYVK